MRTRTCAVGEQQQALRLGGEWRAMTDKAPERKMASQANIETPGAKTKAPDWAGGLRRLYDSVVEEPLPDSFARLLEELDKGPKSDGGHA